MFFLFVLLGFFFFCPCQVSSNTDKNKSIPECFSVKFNSSLNPLQLLDSGLRCSRRSVSLGLGTCFNRGLSCSWSTRSLCLPNNLHLPVLHNIKARLLCLCLSPILSSPVCSHLKQPPFSVSQSTFFCVLHRVECPVCVSVQLYLQPYIFSFILLCVAKLFLTFPLCSFVGFHFTPRGNLSFVTPTRHTNLPQNLL